MGLSVRAVKLALLNSLLLMCTGCGFLFGDEGVFRDKSEDYKQARETPLLKVPAGTDSMALQEIYPIPPVTEDILPTGKFEVPRPAPLVAGASDEMVRIQKLGDESWALVDNAPGQVWPQVRGFLAASRIPVAREDARGGTIESGWLQLEGQSMASRFRFLIDQGVQRGTSELHVLQMNQAGDVNSWPSISNDVALENQMLRSLSQFIANSADATPVSMMADQAITAAGKISMQEGPEGHIFIRLSLPYDRAWASVGRALTESNFEITDRDRSAGKYYVRFLGTETEEEGGWFDWMLGSGDKNPLVGEQFVVVLESLDARDVAVWIQAPGADGEGEPVRIGTRDEQALLALVKGNID